MSLRILAVGDIHLGRLPGSVPSDVAADAGGLDALGPREAWSRTIEAAIVERVHAVLLLGDVVDDEDRYLEGWSALESGLRRLLDSGIEVFAVAGNHDVRVLPALARRLSALRLLGAGGRWESAELANGSARLVGWSYPVAHARVDPTTDNALEDLCRVRFAGPTIGLLHGDLDLTKSEYARFTSARLASIGADVWLLGHIHGPTFARGEDGRIPVGYLGSLTALDPTETGEHGPWLLSFEGRTLVEARQLPIAPLRWERLRLAVDAWSTAAELEPGITGALQQFEARERSSLGSARAVGLRFDLVGSSRVHRELRSAIERIATDSVRLVLEDRIFFVDAVFDRARPALDLASISKQSDPPGLLARRLLALDASPTDTQAAVERVRLLQLARREHAALAAQSGFRNLGREDVTDEELAAELRTAGLAALDDLIATKPSVEART